MFVLGHPGLRLCLPVILSTLVAGLLVVAVHAATPEDEPIPIKDTRQWIETVEPGRAVLVTNPHGNVYSRFGGYENQVEILATIQRTGNAATLEVTRAHSESGLEIRVGPTPEGAPGTDERIDLVVFVPHGSPLEVRTEDGRIEAKGLHGDLIASSIKGDIFLRSIGGRIQAKTARGSISATLETAVTTAAQELTTETGEIEVHLWEDADLDVTIATSAEISTDFSIEIEHRRFEEPGKHASAVVGKGGPRLTLNSKRGHVRLLRLQKHFQPEN